MNDFAYIAIFLTFFAVAGLFVALCDRIIGADEEVLPVEPAGDGEPEPTQVAA